MLVVTPLLQGDFSAFISGVFYEHSDYLKFSIAIAYMSHQTGWPTADLFRDTTSRRGKPIFNYFYKFVLQRLLKGLPELEKVDIRLSNELRAYLNKTINFLRIQLPRSDRRIPALAIFALT